MEIVSHVLDGALDTRTCSATATSSVLAKSSTGRGIVHAEFNASQAEPVHLLQIWIAPSKTGIGLSHERKAIANRPARIAAPEPRESDEDKTVLRAVGGFVVRQRVSAITRWARSGSNSARSCSKPENG